MVTIYALINPFNNEPFYVGSTRVPIKTRLSAHKRGIEGTNEKKQLITFIHQSGKQMTIIPLLKCSEKAAVMCELRVYELLIEKGYTLYQNKHQIRRDNIKYFKSVIPGYKA